MNNHITRAATVAAAIVLSASIALAQQPPASTPGDTPRAQPQTSAAASPSSSDQSFIKKAAAGGMAEVELGQLATQKSSSPQVKQFGQQMADEHKQANEQLKSIAQQKNVTIPSQLAGKEKKAFDKLSKLSGAEFDREYMKLMVDDHQKDVKEFQKASKDAKDSDVKQFATTTLPTLERHLRMAQQTASTVGVTQATSGREPGTGTTGTTGTTDRGLPGNSPGAGGPPAAPGAVPGPTDQPPTPGGAAPGPGR